MTKTEIKDLLFEMLKKNDTFFVDIRFNSRLDALILKTIAGEEFIIKVDYLKDGEETIRLETKKNPFAVIIGLALIQMADLNILTREEAKKYLSEVSKRSIELSEKYERSKYEYN